MRDRTGSLRAIWFNQPFLNDVFHPHQRVILFGKLELTSHGLQMQNPQYEVLPAGAEAAGPTDDEGEAAADDTLHTGRIVPIYEKTGTLTTKMQRVLVHHALAQLPAVLPDPLPADVRAALQLIDRRTALDDVHFPPEQSRRRGAERVPLAGAAPADLRGVLSLPAAAWCCASAAPMRSGSRGRWSSPTRSASRPGACCRSG